MIHSTKMLQELNCQMSELEMDLNSSYKQDVKDILIKSKKQSINHLLEQLPLGLGIDTSNDEKEIIWYMQELTNMLTKHTEASKEMNAELFEFLNRSG